MKTQRELMVGREVLDGSRRSPTEGLCHALSLPDARFSTACYRFWLRDLYRKTRGLMEVARVYGAESALAGDYGKNVYKSDTDLVVAEGRAQATTSGFPLAMTGKQG